MVVVVESYQFTKVKLDIISYYIVNQLSTIQRNPIHNKSTKELNYNSFVLLSFSYKDIKFNGIISDI